MVKGVHTVSPQVGTACAGDILAISWRLPVTVLPASCRLAHFHFSHFVCLHVFHVFVLFSFCAFFIFLILCGTTQHSTPNPTSLRASGVIIMPRLPEDAKA